MSISIRNVSELLCRACLKSSDKTTGLISIYTKDENFKEFETISDLYREYICVNFDEYKEISPFICIECYVVLINFHKFRKMCVISHFEFLKRMHSIKECSIQLDPLILRDEPIVEIVSSDDDDCVEISESDAIGGDPIQPGLVYPCTQCTRIFKSLKYLNKHSLIHTGKFICSICGVEKSTKNGMNMHTYYNHTKPTVRFCEICNRSYSSVMIIYHWKKQHRVTRLDEQYQCTECKKSLANVNEVKEHESAHAGKI